MVHFNKITILGTLSNNPTFTGTGTSMVGQFMIATALKFTNRNNVDITETQWFRVSFFGDTAKDLQDANLSADDKIFVEGRLGVFEYTQDGEDKTSLEIFAEQFAALDYIAPQPSGTEPRPENLPADKQPNMTPKFP